MTEWILAPRPRSIKWLSHTFTLNSQTSILLEGNPSQLFPLGKLLQEDALKYFNFQWNLSAVASSTRSTGSICLQLTSEESLSEQTYRLQINKDSIQIQASTPVGLYYGLMTLRQFFKQMTSLELPCLEILDFPDFPVRGVMLDVSRDKVPTLETLFQLIEQLSEWKINQFQLYMEHTFAYSKHRSVWCNASPYTSEDILKIQECCQQHFMELVPNQNSFGHLHRWLELPEYRHLAECPDGFEWPWGERNGSPFSIAPNHPESIEFLDQLYAELLPNFESSLFNVGCDETFDLGQGQSKEICEQKGKDRVYLEFLLQLYEKVKTHQKTMMFWGDIILQYPDLVKELPKDVIVLEWGYEATHPFEEHSQKFAQSQIPFYVCPGTSSWNSLAGRTKNCIENLSNASKHGKLNGAQGYLITDWGDRGHWQPLPVSYLGYLCGASVSWSLDANQDQDWEKTLNQLVFDDPSENTGKFWFQVGNTYLEIGHLIENNSTLFQLLFRPKEHKVFSKVQESNVHQTLTYIKKQEELLISSRSGHPQVSMWREEAQLVLKLLRHSCYRTLAILQEKDSQLETCQRLEADMKELLGSFERTWLKRNRVGGLSDSLKVLHQRLQEYQGSKNSNSRVF